MKSRALSIVASSVLALCSVPALAQISALGPPTTWSVGAGGNGHSYQVFVAPGTVTWGTASSVATSAGGYLATITSAAENTFVFSLISGVPALWTPNGGGWGSYGPWIGGVNGGSGFGWVTGEAFAYTNWAPGEPNNGCLGGPFENHIQFVSSGGSTPGPYWNDLADGGCPAGGIHPTGFVVEFSNDTCATAMAIVAGTTYTQTNLGATAGPDPTAPCAFAGADLWYSFTPACSGAFVATTMLPGSTLDTVLTAWSGPCGALVPLACDDDTGSTFQSTVSFTAIAGTTYHISVGGYAGSTGTFKLLVSATGGAGGTMGLTLFSAGPGSLGYTITGGPPLGTAFTAVTPVAGAYPAGWFYGIDIPLPDLFSEYMTGFPFVVPLGPCGGATVGPFFGLPPGLTLYAVSVGIPALMTTPTVNSAPTAATIP
jgi:hypothetical protein